MGGVLRVNPRVLCIGIVAIIMIAICSVLLSMSAEYAQAANNVKAGNHSVSATGFGTGGLADPIDTDSQPLFSE